MMKRLDALGRDRERLSAVGGDLLRDADDTELQALVHEAAALTATPIAAVTLVLERTQLFRAQVGLPADLAATRATDRDASFCQLVVRDRAPLEVNDAARDGRVPQDLVDLYGIQAYLGVPVMVGAQPLGALCVIDTAPRIFTAEQRAGLEALAYRVSARLERLSLNRSRDDLAYHGLRPAFASLRNLLMPLETNIAMAKVAAAEGRVVVRLLDHVAVHGTVPAVVGLSRALSAMTDLEGALDDAGTVVAELRTVILALQSAVITPDVSPSMASVSAVATALAEHETKLIGGVRAQGAIPPDHVAVSPTTAVSLVAAGLGELSRQVRARRGSGGLDLQMDAVRHGVEVRLTAPDLGEVATEAVAAGLREMSRHEPSIEVGATAGGVVITLPITDD